MFDVIVVGARCAGASSALLLARAGHRVLLLDRMRFPSDVMSTCYIHPPGVRLLSEWGLLDRITQHDCPKLDRITYRLLDVALHGPTPTHAGVDGAYAPRRTTLDQALVDAAVAAGVEFRDRCRVTALEWDGGRVAGVRYRDAAHRSRTERARLTIGADGMRSTVAELAAARPVLADPTMTCVYYSLWHDVPAQFECYEQPGSWVAVIPTQDDATIVSTYVPQSRFAAVRTDPLSAHLATVKAISAELFERVSAGSRIERLRGSGDQRNFLRTAAGPGWALVGDAGYHKDSITARGITDAFIQADLLRGSIGTLLPDPSRLDAALADYQRRRNEAFAGTYRSTLALAELNATESRIAILRAISASPELTDRYFGVIAGINTMDDLLTEELLSSL